MPPKDKKPSMADKIRDNIEANRKGREAEILLEDLVLYLLDADVPLNLDLITRIDDLTCRNEPTTGD